MSSVRQVLTRGFLLVLGAGLVPVAGAAGAAPDQARMAEAALSAAVNVAFRTRVAGLEDSIIRVVEDDPCPNCGRRHSADLSSLVKKEASIFCTGFRVSADQVVCEDPQLPLENVASVSVSAGSRTVPATVEKRFIDQGAVLLKLESPLPEAPAAGAGLAPEAPAFAVSVTRRARDPMALQAEPAPLLSHAVYGEKGDAWASVRPPAALMDGQGRLCGFTFNAEWRTNGVADPAKWPAYTREELARRTAETVSACERSVLPVTLSFRSPRMSRNGDSSMQRRLERSMGRESGGSDTALNKIGRASCRERV